MPRIVLASQSPRRLELLQQIGIAPEVKPAEIDETVLPGEAPDQYVLRMAKEKAAALPVSDDVLVIGADTAVVIGSTIFGKPGAAEEGAAMLRALAGTTHRVLSAVAVRQGLREASRLSESRVTFRDISDDEIARYWQSGEPVDKAGGYAVQGLGAVFIASIEGSYSGIMGLPLFETSEMLAEFGIALV